MAWRSSASVVTLVVLLALAATTGVVSGAFSGSAGSNGNELRSAPDFVAPTASASVIQKSEGGISGYIRKGGSYRVHANVTDSGNPASGIASVTSNVATLTAGQTVAPLSSGTFNAGGLNYNYRGASLTAGAALAAGDYTYSLTSTDGVPKVRTQTGFPVIVDNTVPTASNIQTTNKTGGTAGRPELGDVVIFTFSEPIDPNSVLPGWTGASTPIVAQIEAHAVYNDLLTIWNATNTTKLPFGSVALGRNDYVNADTTFGAGGTASTMTLSANAITITLGTASGSPTTASSTGAMVWSPSATATDRAGNPESTTSRTETGTADRDF